jgi:hypothetical protein
VQALPLPKKHKKEEHDLPLTKTRKEKNKLSLYSKHKKRRASPPFNQKHKEKSKPSL